jgi:hypothetical protein
MKMTTKYGFTFPTVIITRHQTTTVQHTVLYFTILKYNDEHFMFLYVLLTMQHLDIRV